MLHIDLGYGIAMGSLCIALAQIIIVALKQRSQLNSLNGKIRFVRSDFCDERHRNIEIQLTKLDEKINMILEVLTSRPRKK